MCTPSIVVLAPSTRTRRRQGKKDELHLPRGFTQTAPLPSPQIPVPASANRQIIKKNIGADAASAWKGTIMTSRLTLAAGCVAIALAGCTNLPRAQDYSTSLGEDKTVSYTHLTLPTTPYV